jgi:hypothetical protein
MHLLKAMTRLIRLTSQVDRTPEHQRKASRGPGAAMSLPGLRERKKQLRRQPLHARFTAIN